MMGETHETGMLRFFKHAVLKSPFTAGSHKYMNVWRNILLFVLVFILTVLMLHVVHIPVIELFNVSETDAAWGRLIIYIGLFVYVLVLPAVIMNIMIIYLLSRQFSQSKKLFKEVLSDHNQYMIQTFLIYSFGLYFLSFIETLRPYLTIIGSIILCLAAAVYVYRSICHLHSYLTGRGIVTCFYSILLIVTVMIGLPLFDENIGAGFLKNFIHSIRMLIA